MSTQMILHCKRDDVDGSTWNIRRNKWKRIQFVFCFSLNLYTSGYFKQLLLMAFSGGHRTHI